jgi:hypothetical protein
MTLGQNFPISDYYREQIIDAETISRSGGWWTAVLLISDPRTNKPFVALYRWQHTERGWKIRKQFSFRTKQQGENAIEVVKLFLEKLENS